ncbi:hypothetical protein EUTSA_v10015409mg, partial [Eutrema salsugineum]
TMYTRHQNLRQGTRTIDEYAEEFSLLLTRTEIYDSEVQLVSRFISGLRPQLQSAMAQFDPDTVSEAHRRAVAFEQQFKSSVTGWNSGFSRSRMTGTATSEGSHGQAHKKDTTEATTSNTLPVANSGTEPTLRRSSQPNALRCFACGEPGHLQTACPKQTRRGLFGDETKWDKDDAADDNEDEFDSEVPEDHHHGDTSPSLMLRHVCLAPVVLEEPWLRTNIFQSTCTIKGKVCRFVVDSGSCRNVIAEDAARKLGLKREDHPAPYKLTWLKQGVEIRIEHRCLVSFSIGSHYKDKIYCDVALMDVSHLLLGTPWQYDRSVMHDGRRNSYSFIFENRKIVLFSSPQPPAPSTSCVSQNSHNQEFVKRN